jgi:hypothetical protein
LFSAPTQEELEALGGYLFSVEERMTMKKKDERKKCRQME